MKFTGFKGQRLDAAVMNQIGNAMLREEYRRSEEGIPFTSSDRFTLLNQLMFAAHVGVSPRQLALGRVDKMHKLENIAINFGKSGIEIDYDVVKNEVGTGTDPAAGDPLIENPLLNPTFGASGGVIPPVWLDMMMRESSRFLQAKNFAKIIPMSGPVDMAPLKKTKAEDWITGMKPVKEGRAGTDVRTAYSLWKFDAYKYMYHSGLTLEVVRAAAGKIEIAADLIADMMELYDLLIDLDYFEAQWSALIAGKIRRFDVAAADWAENADIAQGAASMLTVNAPKHCLWYSIADKKLYVPAVVGGNENKFQASTPHPDLLLNLELWDIIPMASSLLKNKRAKAQYCNFHLELSRRLAMDSRFTNSIYKTGSIAFEGEQGYLGRFPIGGSSSSTDVWEMPLGMLDSKVTDDVGPLTIYPILVGEYGRSGAICPWIPPSLGMDKGFEVVQVDGVNVLRPNDTDVFTTKGEQGVIPWDINGIVMIKVVKEAHT